MKITKITVIAFGKIKDKTIETNNEFNAFILNNGEGKTTLFNFICAMFYGVGKNSLSNLRGLYLPFDQKRAAGSIEFVYQNKNYRLDRVFAKTAKDDEATLYDVDTGSVVEISSNEFGKHFFELDEQSFRQTLFVENKDLVVNTTTNLKDLLVNTINTGNAATSLQHAKERLADFEKIVNINKKNSLSYDLFQERNNLSIKLNELQMKNDLILEKIEENKRLQESLNELQERKDFYEKVNSYHKQKELHNKYLKYLSLKDAYENTKKDNTNYDELIEKLNKVNGLSLKENKFYLLVSLAIMVLVCSILLAIFISYPFAFISLLSIAMFVLAFINKNNTKKHNENVNKQKIEEYQKYGFDSFSKSYEYLIFKKQESKKDNHKEYIDFLNENNIEEIIKYKEFTINEKYEDINDSIDILKDIENKISNIKISIAHNEGALSNSSLSGKIASIISKISDIDETLSKYKKYNEELSIAKEVINIANIEIFSNFAPNLKARLKEEIDAITKGKIKDIIIDSSFEIMADEGNNLRKLAYYSQGYKDMIYLALRIAIIKMALNKEKFPIFLDDPFVNLDNENKESVIKYLNELSKTHQIFYFSCNKL